MKTGQTAIASDLFEIETEHSKQFLCVIPS